jgi:Carboxypeptidase regulatory-like domain
MTEAGEVHMSFRARVSALLILLLFAAASAFSQVSTATITGVVQDEAGAVVPGAQVVATQTQTNSIAQAVSDARGVFSLPALPVGPYAMNVTATGFETYQRTNIVLTVGQVANFEVRLAAGRVTETVTVTSGAPLVNPTDPTIENTLDEQTVVGLPLNGRNPATLVFDSGGVANTGENTGTGQLASTNQITPPGVTIPGSIAPAVNGVRAGGTYFSLDGATNVDPLGVIGGPFPNPDATQEFQVVTGTYGSRYLSAPGGAVNIVSRSGTSQFHGTVFEFIRNGYVNAENAILAQPDTLKRNQFGGTFGGPILKNRFFFFGSYQGTRIAAQTVNKYPVPTAAERAGIFQACTAGVTCSSSNEFPVNLNMLPPIFGPNTENSVNANFYNFGGSGQSLIPAANNTANGNSYVIGVPYHSDDEQLVGRLDYQLTSQHRLFARYYFDHLTSPAVNEPTSAPYNIFHTSSALQQFWDNAAVGDTWTPNSKLVFETRLAYLNIAANQNAPSSASFVNYPGLGAADYSNPNPPGIGITVVGNMIPPATYGTFKYPRTNLTFSEDVVYVRGNHEITFGGNFQRVHNGESNPAGQTGVIIYAGVYTNILAGILGLQLQDAPFADFYLGHPIEFIQGDGFFSSNHGWLAGLYGQDKYRITNRLTATYGLRWDPWIPYKPENNRISCFRAGEQSEVFPNAPTGLVYPGDAGCPSGGVNGSYGFVEPRVGIAYQLNQKGTDAIRAGYGLYTIQVPLSALGGFQAFPFTRQYIITNPFQSISDIWGSNHLSNPFAAGFIGFGYNPPSDVSYPATPAANVANFAPNFKPGYVQQYSLSYQKGIGSNDSIELAYVGTKGTRMAQNYDLNQPLPAANASTANEQARRPYQGLAIISTEAPIGYSNYSGAEITYRHRAAHGLDVNSNFTWSKCIDNGSNPGSTGASVAGDIDINPYDPGFSRGLCDFDQPFNWRSTLVWSAPSLAGEPAVVRTAFGSWLLSGNFILDSGQPYSVTTNTSDNSFTATDLDRADYVPGQPLSVNGRLNYSAFALNSPGTFGDTPRNGFRSAPNYEVDTALMKNFALTERLRLMFRAEAFNIINHPNYYGPLNAWDSANAQNFDTYQYARDPRQLQFALKLSF